MIEQIYDTLQRYIGEDIVNILSWLASDADYVLNTGFNEEQVIYIYVLIMGISIMVVFGLLLYAFIQIFISLWKGIKNIL